MKGTHTGGSYLGVPASGKEVEINGTGIEWFEDGEIVEHSGGPHCMHGIGSLAEVEPPTKASAEGMNAKVSAPASLNRQVCGVVQDALEHTMEGFELTLTQHWAFFQHVDAGSGLGLHWSSGNKENT